MSLFLRRLLRSSCPRLVRSSRVFSNGFSSGSSCPRLVRSSRVFSNGFSSGSSSQFPPSYVLFGSDCGNGLSQLMVHELHNTNPIFLEKKVAEELLDKNTIITIGASHGWVGTMKEDGILRLQDDLNPFASDSHPKRIPLPPLVTLPGCQTNIVTNISMSSSSPEDQDCVVAVKFLGPQLSFCRPGQSNPEWTNIRVHHCFNSSRVMFSEKDDAFCLSGSGGHLIGSWDRKDLKDKPKIQRLWFQNLPELSKTKRELLHSCSTTEHLVESRSTGETFLIKWYRKARANVKLRMNTRALTVFKLDGEGNAVYTRDIGDLAIYISKSEPFCVSASSFPGPGLSPNCVELLDFDENAIVFLRPYGSSSRVKTYDMTYVAPYHIPPQNII